MSPLSSNWLARARRSLAVASSALGLAGNGLGGEDTVSQALVCAAINPFACRSAMVISITEVDPGKAISSRSAEPGGKNHVSELIWVAPDKIVPDGAPERARTNASFAASSG